MSQSVGWKHMYIQLILGGGCYLGENEPDTAGEFNSLVTTEQLHNCMILRIIFISPLNTIEITENYTDF